MQDGLPSREEVALWAALVRFATSALASIERDLAAAGAPPLSVYDVLYAVYCGPGHSLQFSELQHGLILTKSGLSRAVDSLVRSRHLSKTACANDLRRQIVTLTPKGKSALRRIWRIYGPGISREFSRKLTIKEKGELAKLLEALAQ